MYNTMKVFEKSLSQIVRPCPHLHIYHIQFTHYGCKLYTFQCLVNYCYLQQMRTLLSFNKSTQYFIGWFEAY